MKIYIRILTVFLVCVLLLTGIGLIINWNAQQHYNTGMLEQYRENVGCTLKSALDFLDYLKEEHIPVTVRQVIIPTVNDSRENMIALKAILADYPNVDKVELLPFRKICQTKYDNMKIAFPFGHLPAATKSQTDELHKILEE